MNAGKIVAAGAVSVSLLWATSVGAASRALPPHLALHFFPAFEMSCEEGYASIIDLGDVAVGPDAGEAWDCFGVFAGNDSDQQARGLNVRSEDIAFVLEWMATYDVVEGLQPDSHPELSGLRANGQGQWTLGKPVTFPSTWMLAFRRGDCWAGWLFLEGTYASGSYQLNFVPQGGGCVAGGEGFGYTHVSVWGAPAR